MNSVLYFICFPGTNDYGADTIVEYKIGLIKKESII